MTSAVRHRMQPLPLSVAAVVAVLVALLVLPLALAPRTEAYVYWTGGQAIGRANLDGTDVDKSFIPVDDVEGATGLAVDTRHVYWANGGYYAGMGRASLDGTGVDQSFISGFPYGLTVDASHVYWTESPNVIARANLDGTNIDQSFIISDAGGYYPPIDLAVDASHIYWTQSHPASGTIARANLDGTNADQSFIAPTATQGLAVDADHIYWTTGNGIARADLDGTDVDQTLISGLDDTSDLAVDASHIYWAQHVYEMPFGGWTRGRIGRANLDGTRVDQNFLTLGDNPPHFLAVDALTDTKADGKASAVRTQRQTGKRIVVRVTVKANEPLTAKATGKIKVNPTYKLQPKKVNLAADEARTLRLKPSKAAAKKIARALDHGKKTTAKLTVTLTDQAGNSESEKLRVRLKR